MGSAYTPGLKVNPLSVILRARRLPLKGEVMVTQGQAVTPATIVARAMLPGLMQSVKVAKQLGVEPADLPEALAVKVGDRIEKGQVLAATRAFFGLFKSEAKSPVAGTVETVSSITGNVGVRQAPSPINLSAYVAGTIAEVMPDEGVVVRVEGALIQGIFGVGGERVGVIRVVSSSPEAPLTTDDITSELAGKIIVGGANITAGALTKASEVGVRGIVVGGIVDRDLVDFLGYDIGVAITGDEKIDLTLVITEGFGTIAMADRTFKLLQKLDGKAASINGATQIRAGVIRPEIIVPRETAEAFAVPAEQIATLDVGSSIRLIREPYFGVLATVKSLPAELTRLDSGAMVRVLEAELQDGTRVIVPRANIEIMEG